MKYKKYRVTFIHYKHTNEKFYFFENLSASNEHSMSNLNVYMIRHSSLQHTRIQDHKRHRISNMKQQSRNYKL